MDDSLSSKKSPSEQTLIEAVMKGRITRRRFVQAAVALGMSGTLIGVVLDACGSSSLGSGSGTPVKGGTLTMARSADADNLDPYNTVEDQGIFIDLQIFDRLVRLSADGQSIEPELAKSWQYSSDGKSITFALQSGITFSDGSPLTADDVAFSLNRAFDPNSNWSFLYGPVRSNWPKEGGSVSAVDAQTVKIDLDQPFAPLLAALTTFASSIYPKANYQKWGDKNLTLHPVGTGAYMLESWDPGVQLTLTKNPKYRDAGKVYLDKIVFKVIKDDNARALQLQAKAVDLIDQVSASQISSITSTGDQIFQVKGAQDMFVRFNYKVDPYQDVNVRLALAWAADRQKMATDIFKGYADPGKSLVPASCLFYDGNQDAPGFDLNKAKSYLSQSSKPNGFSDTLLFLGGDSNYNSAMQIWAQDLKQIGINLTLQPTDPAQLGSIVYKSTFSMAGLYFTPDTPDPDEIMGLVDYAIANAIHTYFHDDQLHEMLAQARANLDATSRAQQYSAIQKRINDLAVTINFTSQPRLYAGTPNVHGFQPSHQGRYYFENVWKSS